MTEKDERILCKVFSYLERKGIFYEFGEGNSWDFDKPVLAMNWNEVPSKFWEFVEGLGVEPCWDDEITHCYECGKFINLNPGYIGDEGNYIKDPESYPVCRECVEKNPQILVESYEDCSFKAIPSWAIPLIEKIGFSCMGEESGFCKIYASGFYPGQNDSPEKILEELEEELGFDVRNKYEIIWAIESIGQFDIHFTFYLREDISIL